ncbi:MAG: hypothetical protein M9920_07570 [Verrucomicrobiae bacterium]|nr:hypothetical protein [Verrucomicrobiae bacterium]
MSAAQFGDDASRRLWSFVNAEKRPEVGGNVRENCQWHRDQIRADTTPIVRLAEALSPTKYPMSARRPQKETARFRFAARRARFRWTDGGYGNAAVSTGEVVGASKVAASLEPFAEDIAFIE